jgi:methylated-DNA-[protein]-cysteine S-methyltransferase
MRITLEKPVKEESLYFASSKINGISFKVYTSQRAVKEIYVNGGDRAESKFSKYKATMLQPDDPFMFNIFKQLEEYFNLKRKYFELPLDLKGTSFQVRVWNLISSIPYGQTISYKDIAESLGSDEKVRAVGQAVGANPFPIVIPCHRVINANGNLGGYGLGLPLKEKLLELEGILSMELFDNGIYSFQTS